MIVNIITDSNASGQPVTVNEGVYACPFNIIDTNGVTHTDDALSVDLNFNVGLGSTTVQPMAVSLDSATSPTWHQNTNYDSDVGNQLAWLEQYAFTNAKNQPGGATADQFAAIQIEAWNIIDPNFTWSYSYGGDGAAGGDGAVVTADVSALQSLLAGGPGAPAASFVGTPNYNAGANYTGTLLSLDPGVAGVGGSFQYAQYQNLITPANVSPKPSVMRGRLGRHSSI